MDQRIELIFVPVADADRAKAFFVDRLGWHADHDQRVSDELRFVQVTPPGSACSIAFGEGISDDEPGTLRSVQLVVDDADALHAALTAAGVDAGEVEELAWGRFVTIADPDGNRWTFQQLPDFGVA
ncbi:glyoxalase superfamily protein [Agrococcus sp. SL85]|uniref:glyoxalase superfamily protein n=1 Tax=Agrococcus sp. SL85 TaxID=2995141 RepID=UPI00226C6BCB|nr:glyoxalase superfamily protein [Agrococcus sp. SL85]WAC66605.1 glyoxalase superfamily protein [Agrococcus sp. SL85]